MLPHADLAGGWPDRRYPSIDAIRLALPPAAVVSMQVTRSVAKRAT
jgi:hypothetical protein